jgi:hypothetical protein
VPEVPSLAEYRHLDPEQLLMVQQVTRALPRALGQRVPKADQATFLEASASPSFEQPQRGAVPAQAAVSEEGQFCP